MAATYSIIWKEVIPCGTWYLITVSAVEFALMLPIIRGNGVMSCTPGVVLVESSPCGGQGSPTPPSRDSDPGSGV